MIEPWYNHPIMPHLILFFVLLGLGLLLIGLIK